MTITNGGRAGSGRRIDLSDDLDLGSANTGGGAVTAALGRHRLGITYQPLSFSGETRPSNDLVFHGSTFPAGEHVRSDVDLRFIIPRYDYALVESDTAVVRAGIGSYVWTFDARLRGATAAGTTEERAFTHVLPALASSIAVPLASWDIGADLAFGLIGSNRRVIDAEPFVARRFGPHVAVGAGYRFLDFVFHETTNRGDFFFHGPFVSLALGFPASGSW